jgi:hypothetical protein
VDLAAVLGTDLEQLDDEAIELEGRIADVRLDLELRVLLLKLSVARALVGRDDVAEEDLAPRRLGAGPEPPM